MGSTRILSSIAKSILILLPVFLFIYIADYVGFTKELFRAKKFEEKYNRCVKKVRVSFIFALVFGIIILCSYGGVYYYRYHEILEMREDYIEEMEELSGEERLERSIYYNELFSQKEKEEELTSIEVNIIKGKTEQSFWNIVLPNPSSNLLFLFYFAYIVISGLFYPIYMLPSKNALEQRHKQSFTIIWLNALLGWTFTIWLILFIWLNSNSNKQQ